MQKMFNNRWTHKETDDFLLELERAPDGNLFLHISVYRWTPRVYREIMNEWLSLEDILRDSDEGIIYGILPSKNEEFAIMFGWTLHGKRNGYTLASKEII
jgi:hypothetical protein